MNVILSVPLQRKDVEEFAENSFNLNRKGIWNKQTTVTKVLSWKSVSCIL